ncbi:MAG: tRNA uridine-5-carboxymethylaminomethyl(34) synthesis GTPase MnmE [Ignavibacteriales bacterium]|nr:tRNA uridine-5-carboxymethylaminomethyl(34) synthesis GTPase MnmE [Ignavibacteriales bacterium]
MLLSNEDTIAAIATPIGIGAISVIRVSGPDSIESVSKAFVGKKNLNSVKTHTIHYGKIVDQNHTIIDDVLVSVFKSPHSYTGEDSIEISTHGSPFVSNKILETLLKQNIRLAEPGEFTKRAFLNGRIDLSQAEAVIDIINSRTNASLKGARSQFDGLLSQKIDALRQSLINSSSLIELELDFAEEDLQFVSLEKVRLEIKNTILEIQKLVDTYKFGKVLVDGVNAVFVGRPNVGKSSLLNYLVKESRAIVSHIPGTTRDVIREEISIDGVLFKIFDTAGIRFSDDEIEKEGVLRSRKAVENADIVVLISDVFSGFPFDLYDEILKLTNPEKVIFVINKIDLNNNFNLEDNYGISAKTGDGIEKFLEVLKKKSFITETFSEKNAVVSNLRHKTALEKTIEHLVKTIDSIDKKLSGEFISVDLRNAESALGEIIGKVTTDDILNNIFSKFCIGK